MSRVLFYYVDNKTIGVISLSLTPSPSFSPFHPKRRGGGGRRDSPTTRIGRRCGFVRSPLSSTRRCWCHDEYRTASTRQYFEDDLFDWNRWSAHLGRHTSVVTPRSPIRLHRSKSDVSMTSPTIKINSKTLIQSKIALIQPKTGRRPHLVARYAASNGPSLPLVVKRINVGKCINVVKRINAVLTGY